MASSPVKAQAKLIKNLFSHVMKSAEVDAHFAKIQDSWDVYTKTNHAVTFRVNTRSCRRPITWKPTNIGLCAKARQRSPCKPARRPPVLHRMSAPATSSTFLEMFRMKSIPARADSNTWQCGYSLRAAARGGGAGRAGGAPLPEPTTYFATKAQIDKTFADEPRSTQLRFPGGANVAMIIYNGAIGPYESHEDVDQIYFVRHGTAKAAYDGRLVNPTVTTPGQIRGTGYLDASEYTIAPGDIVWIPRNQMHFVDPGIGKVGYFLIGMPSSQSGFPEPPPTPAGRGGRGGQ